eukprot:10848244-Alexandrium_andersonii.AAC.1
MGTARPKDNSTNTPGANCPRLTRLHMHGPTSSFPARTRNQLMNMTALLKTRPRGVEQRN